MEMSRGITIETTKTFVISSAYILVLSFYMKTAARPATTKAIVDSIAGVIALDATGTLGAVVALFDAPGLMEPAVPFGAVMFDIVALLQTTLAHNDAFDMDEGSPGCESPVDQSVTGFDVWFHTQHGSPSSWPFVWPSPSESIMHSDVTHCSPSASKS